VGVEIHTLVVIILAFGSHMQVLPSHPEPSDPRYAEQSLEAVHYGVGVIDGGPHLQYESQQTDSLNPQCPEQSLDAVHVGRGE
jgi:hypothetical protein